MKSVCIRSFSAPYFPAFGLNTERYGVSLRKLENTDQEKSEYEHFTRCNGSKFLMHTKSSSTKTHTIAISWFLRNEKRRADRHLLKKCHKNA